MLKQVAEGVRLQQSEFCQTNTIVVQGKSGVLLVDPGVLDEEMAGVASELSDAGLSVEAGFSTHPHWDHLLWHRRLGSAPRYGTARCASIVGDWLADGDRTTRSAGMLPPDIADRVSLELLGLIIGLPTEADRIPWDAHQIRIFEHEAHASAHSALLIEDRRVLLAGDMLSDVLIPLLAMSAADPIEDYLSGLRLLESLSSDIDVFVPGHGSAGGAEQLRARVELDRAYLNALSHDTTPDDPRIGPSAVFDLTAVHEHQREQLAQKR